MQFKVTFFSALLLGCLAAGNLRAQGTQQGTNQLPDWTKDLAGRIQLHGYAQGGFNYTHKGGKDTNTFEIKRTLFWANAQITDRWAFCFMHDFSSVVQEYYTDYRLTDNKALNVSASDSSKTDFPMRIPFRPRQWRLLMYTVKA